MQDNSNQIPPDFLPLAIRPPESMEKVAEIGNFISQIVGAIGGTLNPVAGVVAAVIGYLLGGYADGRKLRRIADVVEEVNRRVTNLEGVSLEYVKSEEFIDLTEQIMERATKERNKEKRQIYGVILADAIQFPNESYDEKLRFLRVLEELQPAHLQMLSLTVKNVNAELWEASRFDIMRYAQIVFGDLTEEQWETIYIDLREQRIFTGNQEPRELANLTKVLTPMGQRFLKYLVE